MDILLLYTVWSMCLANEVGYEYLQEWENRIGIPGSWILIIPLLPLVFIRDAFKNQ